MDTMIVEIFLPSVNQSHDFILPAHVPVGSILRYLTDVVRACANVDIDPDHPCLCDLDTRFVIFYTEAGQNYGKLCT